MLEAQTEVAGRYRITGVIAEGGMGVVYRGTDLRLNRPVALKTVRRDDADLVRRLRREARLLARLSHPNIVSIYSVAEHDGQPYLVSELVEGESLRLLLGRLPAARVADIGRQIAEALVAAHAVGIVHRDLKPGNVLVAGDSVRLLDFGIARQTDDTTLTTAGTILGAASSISPEQLRGVPPGPPADIYALGLVLLECFSGRAAYPGTFAESVASRLVSAPELPPAMPAAWHELIRSMTAIDPDDRPTAPEVAAALGTLCGPECERRPVPIRAGLAGAGRGRQAVAGAGRSLVARRRLVLPGVAAGLLAVVVSVNLLGNDSQSPGPPAAAAGSTPTTTGAPPPGDASLVVVSTVVPTATAPVMPSSGARADGTPTAPDPRTTEAPADEPTAPPTSGGPAQTAPGPGRDRSAPAVSTTTTTAAPNPRAGVPTTRRSNGRRPRTRDEGVGDENPGAGLGLDLDLGDVLDVGVGVR
jgi:eukaryotic-like serine/threonine-protein kinase